MSNQEKHDGGTGKKLKDNFWLWGQTAGTHHSAYNNHYQLPGENKMTPAEGCEYLGIPNCCRVVMENKPIPPFDEESKALAHLKQVVWSIVGSCGSVRNNVGLGDIDEVIRQAKMFPNITGGVLDDFLNQARLDIFPLEKVIELRNKLNTEIGRPMDLWVVLYDEQLDTPIQSYLDVCDVITFWTWCGSNLVNMDRNMERMVAMTPHKRRLAGCYMWNYGESKPLEIAQMEYQCERYLNYIRKGYIEGIIFCSNCIADVGIEAVEWTKNWIRRVGNEAM
jgi:hypothetical protein